jgi:hypothetical protein
VRIREQLNITYAYHTTARVHPRYFYGTLPPTPPPLVAASHSAETAVRGGVSFTATLVFATSDSHNVSLSVEVIRPTQPWPPGTASSSYSSHEGQHRHPVFLTQANHRRWAIKGVARGYVGVSMPISLPVTCFIAPAAPCTKPGHWHSDPSLSPIMEKVVRVRRFYSCAYIGKWKPSNQVAELLHRVQPRSVYRPHCATTHQAI